MAAYFIILNNEINLAKLDLRSYTSLKRYEKSKTAQTLKFLDDNIDRNTSFLIYNAIWIILVDLFFGIFVPIKHIIISYKTLPVLWNRMEVCPEKEFFTNMQRLEPPTGTKQRLSVEMALHSYAQLLLNA